MNTTTQQQMTSERNGFGRSLRASLLQAAPGKLATCGFRCQQPMLARHRGIRQAHAHHIRGGNP